MNTFANRHIGISSDDCQKMLKTLGCNSLEALIAQCLPSDIAPIKNFDFAPKTEAEVQTFWKDVAAQNGTAKSFIGQGVGNVFFPALLRRQIFENPAWYSAYTPYQAEISQGRLEVLMIFQEMIADLTGLDVANASLLDEASAAAEAMLMARRISKNKTPRFWVDSGVFAHVLAVLKTRAAGAGVELVVGNPKTATGEFFGALFAYPQKNGEIVDFKEDVERLKSQGIVTIFCADLFSLLLLKSPADFGADIAIGSTQRFGLPPGFGGPHAAFLSAKKEFLRHIPGRIIGLSKDASGAPAFRMALQTREQHIRREKAHSNICTAQVLTAILSTFFALYHGQKGLCAIANRIYFLASKLKNALLKSGVLVRNKNLFDTLQIQCAARSLTQKAEENGMLFWCENENFLTLTVDETTTQSDIQKIFTLLSNKPWDVALDDFTAPANPFQRTDLPLKHPIFSRFQSEVALTRYIHALENKDFALNRGMIPLGSCTMKLNAASILSPLSWETLGNIHPFAPESQTKGMRQILQKTGEYLKTITKMDAITLQPNSGAQGELTGLLTIKNYLKSQNQIARKVCLIPQSAHGTNPASAALAGFEIVTILCDIAGNIDFADFKEKAEKHSARLACLMLTYPSTHGVFEENIPKICEIVHQQGGQVYMDGANLNAQVGLMAPGLLGADIAHMNLHKTFALPHGGGGPGVGAVACKAHLARFLPGENRADSVAAYPFGSALLNVATLFYLEQMGARNLKRATQTAILNANYIAAALKDDFPILYVGKNARVAHECIVDLRPIKKSCGITEIDIAKRLMDYGFHAPTVSFPVAGTLMVEPTESEPLEELDRFIKAMKAIKAEIAQVENGTLDKTDNPLKNAPHTLKECTANAWNHAYSREMAAFSGDCAEKYWPAVKRIDDVFGDRNPQCRLPIDF